LDATGKNCVQYEFGGPQSSSGGGQVLGTSTGKVLGANTMAKTGGFEENLHLAIMTLGGIFTTFGIRNFKKAAKTA
jgi:hypothetical protein